MTVTFKVPIISDSFGWHGPYRASRKNGHEMVVTAK